MEGRTLDKQLKINKLTITILLFLNFSSLSFSQDLNYLKSQDTIYFVLKDIS